MTVRAQQVALGRFVLDRCPLPVGKCSRVELKSLARGIAMVEFQGSEIARVPTSHALAVHQADQPGFVAAAAFVLFGVALMMIVGMPVLACA